MRTADFTTITVARRLSLYRNLASAVFPERASPDEAKSVREKISAVCKALAGREPGAPIDEIARGDAGWIERMAAYERLFDGDVEEDKRGDVVFIESRHLPEIIVNASDHLEFASDCSGMSYRDALQLLNKTVEEFGKRLNFASGEPFGWLSANPAHAGVGMQISQGFCFGALFILRELDAVLRGIERIGFDVYPMYHDPDADDMQPELAPGCCYWVSPIPNDGMDANALAEKSERVFNALAEIEKNARLALFSDNVSADLLEDYAMRAVGIGAGARAVSETEYIDLYAALAFSVDMGVFKDTRPPSERRPLFDFFRESVALFDLQEMAAAPDMDDEHLDFLKKRFLADLARRDFLRVVPEWLGRAADNKSPKTKRKNHNKQ